MKNYSEFISDLKSLVSFNSVSAQKTDGAPFGIEVKNALNYFLSRAKEMGFKNQDEYEKEACRFFHSNEGILYFSERRKRFYRYDEKRKRLVTSSNGIIHTFMELTDKKFKDKISN